VNAVAPGYIDTDMTRGLPEELKKKMLAGVPLGRMGQPEDVANRREFLASDEASTSPASARPSTEECTCRRASVGRNPTRTHPTRRPTGAQGR